jgi:hypothetical protein
MSDSYYEDILIPFEGIAVKMGVSNSFEDDFYYENHVYDMTKSNTEIEEINKSKVILVHSLIKNVAQPNPEKYLDIYGSIGVDIRDLDHIVVAIRKVATDIKSGNYGNRQSIDNGSKIEKSLSDYGGEIIYGQPRGFKSKDPSSNLIPSAYEIAYHVHEWRDFQSGEYDILITGLAKTEEDTEFYSHDYDSIFIRIDHEEKFIAALEQMKVRLENSISISEDS